MTVELREFVTKTLSDIRNGVADAQKEGCVVMVRAGPGVVGAERIVVKFDVAVTVEASDAAKVGSGFKIAVLGFGASIGGDLGTTSKNSTVSRIEFNVPMEVGGDQRTS